MGILQDVCFACRCSKDKKELLEIIRAMIPGTVETRNIVSNLEHNPIYDAQLRLEVLCKVPDRYYSYEVVDYIIACADNTELLKRLYNADINRFGGFVAVNIKDAAEIEKMYHSGNIVIQRAVVCNSSARTEFLKKVIEESSDARIIEFATETLKGLARD